MVFLARIILASEDLYISLMIEILEILQLKQDAFLFHWQRGLLPIEDTQSATFEHYWSCKITD
jgi:hypothetical protein